MAGHIQLSDIEMHCVHEELSALDLEEIPQTSHLLSSRASIWSRTSVQFRCRWEASVSFS